MAAVLVCASSDDAEGLLTSERFDEPRQGAGETDDLQQQWWHNPVKALRCLRRGCGKCNAKKHIMIHWRSRPEAALVKRVLLLH